jgi:RNA 3'-terminal phosphate cyclase-like protein
MSPLEQNTYTCAFLVRSPGYGLCLVGETTTSSLVFSEWSAEPGITPEDVGSNGAKQLLARIRTLACVDGTYAWLALLLMVLGPEDVSTLRIGNLSTFT